MGSYLVWVCIVAQKWNRTVHTVNRTAKILIMTIVCAQRSASVGLTEERWRESSLSVGCSRCNKNAVTRDSRDLGLSWNTQMPPTPSSLPPSHPYPRAPPSAKLPHFNPIVCIELREMIFRRQWVPCREKKKGGGLECVSEVVSTPQLMESN